MSLRIARWIPATGIVFAVLVVVGVILEADTPDKNAADAAWVSHYADAGNRHGDEISFFFIALAAVFFLLWLGSLRGLLARLEGDRPHFATMAVASGTAFISLAVLAHIVGTAMSWAKSHYGDALQVDAGAARLLATVSFLMFVMSLFAAAAMAVATATLALRTRAFPQWLAWLTVLAAVAGLFGIFGFPSLVVLAWIVVLSAWMTFAPGALEPPAAAP